MEEHPIGRTSVIRDHVTGHETPGTLMLMREHDEQEDLRLVHETDEHGLLIELESPCI